MKYFFYSVVGASDLASSKDNLSYIAYVALFPTEESQTYDDFSALRAPVSSLTNHCIFFILMAAFLVKKTMMKKTLKG